MPRARSLVDQFPQIATIPIEQVINWLKKGYDTHQAENRLANFLLYPQTIPEDEADLAFELALLRALISQEPNKYLNTPAKRIIIPHLFLEICPDISELVWAFIDALHPMGITTIVMYTDGQKSQVLGTIIKPEIEQQKGESLVWLDNKLYKLEGNNLVIFPSKQPEVFLKFQSESAKLEGQHELDQKVTGGEMGIIIDTRLQWIKF